MNFKNNLFNWELENFLFLKKDLWVFKKYLIFKKDLFNWAFVNFLILKKDLLICSVLINGIFKMVLYN